MKEIQFRTLKAEEIECRPAMVKDGKATMLLYIDSRSVGRLLDETVGPMGWTMEFTEVNGQIVGKMGIWDEEKGQWVYKCDTGSESNIEAQKGLFSDCYKRCLSRWGVNELYTAPKIVIPDDGYGNSGYKVSEITYNDNREIVSLTIVNRFGKVAYSFPETAQNKPVEKPKVQESAADYLDTLRAFCRARMKEEPEWGEDIKRFGSFWAEKIGNWSGKFDVERLYTNWCEKRKKAA